METSCDVYMKLLSSGFTHLRECGKLCDTVLVTADRQLLAHSVVLAAASPVFRAAFQSCIADGCTRYRLQLDGIDGQLMEAILNCIYCGLGAPLMSICSTLDAESVAEICEQLGVSWIISDKGSSSLLQCNQQSKGDKCPLIQLSENGIDSSDICPDNTVVVCDSLTTCNNKADTTSSLNSATETVNSLVTNEHYPFTCDVCGQQFSVGTALRLHRSHHKGCVTCTDCGHSFSTSAILRRHSLMLCPRKSVTCNVCQELFKGWPNLARHTTLTHPEAYACHFCGQAFLHFDQLLAHISVHAANAYQSQSSHQNFRSLRQAERHVRKHVTHCDNFHVSSGRCPEEINGNEWISGRHVNLHDGDRSATNIWNVNGDACLTEYSVSDFINGTSYQQKGIDATACSPESQVKEIVMPQLATAPLLPHTVLQIPLSVCNFPAGSGQNLCLDKQHEQNVISVSNPLDSGVPAGKGRVTCAKCYRTFKRLSDLHVHMRCHTGEMRYKCSVCNRPFRKNGTLARHMRVHTGDRPYICETCGKSYKLLFHLHLHMTVHSSSRPFSCEICSKSFQSAENLKKHRFVHSGVKPFSCPICTRMFNRRSNMHAHMRLVHDSARQHEVFGQEHICILCRKKFGSMASLQQHLQTHARQIEMDVGETIVADNSADMTFVTVEKQQAEDAYVSLPLHFDDFDVS